MIVRKPVMLLVNSRPFFPMLSSSRREEILEARVEELEAEVDWEYGWAADERSQHWYATKEEAEEFLSNPRQFRRRRAGRWESVE